MKIFSRFSLFVLLLAIFTLLPEIQQSVYASNTMLLVQQQSDKDARYKEHLRKGDEFYKMKKFSSAMIEYEKASDLKPDEEEPKLKMQSIEATLGIRELEELRRKITEEKRLEKERLAKKEDKSVKPVVKSEDFESFLSDKVATSRLDSIRKAIFERFADTLRVVESGTDKIAKSVVYTQIAEAFSEAGDDEMSLKYYQKSLQIEVEYGYFEKASNIYDGMANVYYVKGDFDKSIDTYEKSIDLKEKTGDKKGASDGYSNIGVVYETTYDYDNAIENYEKSAEIKTSIDDKEGLQKVMDNLGNVYYKQKVLESSILSYKKSVDILEELNSTESLGPIYNKLGLAHYEKGNYDEAEKFFNESSKLLHEAGNEKEVAMTQNNLGNLYYIKNRFEKAIDYYEKSLSLKSQEKYDYGRSITLFNLGNAYRRTGDYTKATEYYEESKKIADKLNLAELSAKNLKALDKVYTETKDEEKLFALRDELSNTDLVFVSIEIPVSENEMDFEIDKTQKAMKLLNDEALNRRQSQLRAAEQVSADLLINNLNKQYSQEQQKNKKFVILSIALGSVLVILLLLFIFRSSKKRKKV
ncbi:MAG: tetratricopeptide repeat protein [Bacteroidales bacterium]|nr:tetratricopeptide repeat protein [Bacteroidales bacterium]